jgi:hypothetical protein
MGISKVNLLTTNNCITIRGRFDIEYWCERLAVSPFTLFHLVRTVGNNVTAVEDFIHTSEVARFNESTQSLSTAVQN